MRQAGPQALDQFVLPMQEDGALVGSEVDVVFIAGQIQMDDKDRQLVGEVGAIHLVKGFDDLRQLAGPVVDEDELAIARAAATTRLDFGDEAVGQVFVGEEREREGLQVRRRRAAKEGGVVGKQVFGARRSEHLRGFAFGVKAGHLEPNRLGRQGVSIEELNRFPEVLFRISHEFSVADRKGFEEICHLTGCARLSGDGDAIAQSSESVERKFAPLRGCGGGCRQHYDGSNCTQGAKCLPSKAQRLDLTKIFKGRNLGGVVSEADAWIILFGYPGSIVDNLY